MNIIKYSLGIFLYMVYSQSWAQLYKPVELKCEYLKQPLGIDVARPRFLGLLSDPRNGATQTGNQEENQKIYCNGKLIYDNGVLIPAIAEISFQGIKNSYYTFSCPEGNWAFNIGSN